MSEVMEKDTLAGEQTQTAEAQQAAEELLAQDPALASCPATAERVQELFTQNANTLN